MDQSKQSTDTAVVESILVVDCGTLYTRAVLIDAVDEEYRFVGSAEAPTTVEPPLSDITIGVYNAIAELEAATGRHLIDGGHIVTPQHADGHGVDLFLATCSAAPALRLVVAGLTRDYSSAAAQIGIERTYSDVLDVLNGDDPLPLAGDALAHTTVLPGADAWRNMQVRRLLAVNPDAVVLVGGIEGGPVTGLLKLADVLVTTLVEVRRREERAALIGGAVTPPPKVIFAGNTAALPWLRATLADHAEIIAVPNVQPAIDETNPEPLRAALQDLYQTQALPHLAGYDKLATTVRGAIVPTGQATELVTRYVGAQYAREVLTADVGAASTMLVRAGAAGGPFGKVLRGDFGVAQGLMNVLAEAGPEQILRWLPFAFTPGELTDWALNRVLRPIWLPQTLRDLIIEYAFAREALRAALAPLHRQPGLDLNRYDLLIGTGGVLAHVPRMGHAALLLLDALEPTGEGVGSFELALDTTELLPAIGAIAPIAPDAAAYVFDRDCLLWLGTCIVPLGTPAAQTGRSRRGKRTDVPATTADGRPLAVEITIDYAGGAGSSKIEVPFGTIQVISLRPEQRAALTVRPGPGFRIGNEEPGKLVQTSPGEEVKGGLIGLVVDARGRPLRLPEDDATRQARLIEWGRAVRAYSAREMFDNVQPTEAGADTIVAPAPASFAAASVPGVPAAAVAAAVAAAATLPDELAASTPVPPPPLPPAPEAVDAADDASGAPMEPARAATPEDLAPAPPNSPFTRRRRGTGFLVPPPGMDQEKPQE